MTHNTRAKIAAAFINDELVICEYCGRDIYIDRPATARDRAVGDHRTPRARGGTDHFGNIAVVCSYCDRLKGPLTFEEFACLRDDPEALAHMRATVSTLLNGVTIPVERTRSLRRQAKRARRESRYADRLRPPDPSCVICDGTGMWRPGRVRVRCRCTLTPKKPPPGHVNGRRREAS